MTRAVAPPEGLAIPTLPSAPVGHGVPGASFSMLGLPEPVVHALTELGYALPLRVQLRAVPHAIAGDDVLAWAPAGAGKTAALLLGTIGRISERGRGGVRALVLAPTAERAARIAERAAGYTKHAAISCAVVTGGVHLRAQPGALRDGAELLVATPRRLLDLVHLELVRLDQVHTVVLDGVDRMHALGLLPDVRRILGAVPAARQTSMFSTTMPEAVVTLARGVLRAPVHVAASPTEPEDESSVTHLVYDVESGGKGALLERLLADTTQVGRVLVFVATRRAAQRVTVRLERSGVAVATMGGDESPGEQETTRKRFESGELRVLVATDVGAGILTADAAAPQIINYDLPKAADAYVRRVRLAAARGRAISFCGRGERARVADIERRICRDIRAVEEPSASPDPVC